MEPYYCYPYDQTYSTFDPNNLNTIYNEQGKILYTVSEGDTQRYFQPDTKVKQYEKIIYDGIPGFDTYPFNTQCKMESLKSIKINLNGATLTVEKDKLICSKPILIDIKQKSLYLWSSEYREHKLLTSTGSSVTDGYNILDFNNRKIKVNSKYEYLTWQLRNLMLSNIEFKGDNCEIIIKSDVLDDNMNIKCCGSSQISFKPKNYNTLDIFSTNNNINFNYSNVNRLKLEIEGHGNIKNITCKEKIICKLVGPCTAQITKSGEIKENKTIFGNGKLIYE